MAALHIFECRTVHGTISHRLEKVFLSNDSVYRRGEVFSFDQWVISPSSFLTLNREKKFQRGCDLLSEMQNRV
jgi:hypothetical protein